MNIILKHGVLWTIPNDVVDVDAYINKQILEHEQEYIQAMEHIQLLNTDTQHN